MLCWMLLLCFLPSEALNSPTILYLPKSCTQHLHTSCATCATCTTCTTCKTCKNPAALTAQVMWVLQAPTFP
ncbi:uncharacterized protein MEPE_04008 [Melanopsichium pennsylvanicum]|uniref:Uncharacterized protein n=1 Tax=Melanopsichium pennsylvanicum TaxID=63383 RepID=A0AAJ4XM11_9BASI|nr:uncharacterized protein MEPE_04008 [Melanopsichium pennsylvanicum]